MLHYTCFTLLNGKDLSGLMLMKYFKIPLGSIKGKRCGPHIVFKWSILVLKQQYTTLSFRFTILIALSNPILHLIDHSGCFESSVHVTAAICLLPHHPSPELLSVCLLPQCLNIPRTRSGKSKRRQGMSLQPQPGSVPLHCTEGGSWDFRCALPMAILPSPISHREKQELGYSGICIQETEVPIYFSKCYRLCLSSQKMGSMTITNHSH